MKKIKNTLKTPHSPKQRPRNDSAQPAVEKAPVKANHDLQQTVREIRIQINDVDNIQPELVGDGTACETSTVNPRFNTLPRTRPKSERVVVSVDSYEPRPKSESIGASEDTCTRKVKLRRRISLNPSWKAVS